MAQETEIEKKNLLTKPEFDQLCKDQQINTGDFFWQANTYFDTPAQDIKQQGAALRVREKNNSWELTLKQPAQEGLLETNEDLDAPTGETVAAGGPIPEGEVKQALVESLKVDPAFLEKLGTLETYRAQTPFKTGMLFLDHSKYWDTEDFELELEGPSENEVQMWFTELLTRHDIPERSTPNKIKRFFTRKQKIQGDNNN